MARFAVRKIRFGRAPQDEDDEGGDLPRPMLLKLKLRRAAGIREAKDTLAHLPGPGESLHAVMTARLDMTDVVNALLEKLGRCDRAMIATLGYNRRNYRTMLYWLDIGAIGSLALVASLFFRSHNGGLALETIEEFRARGQRAAFGPCHCKVITLAFASGTRLSVEGSANLCSNGSAREQFTVIDDGELHDWHSRWIESLVVKYAGQADQRAG
jgi:hypothetical protein